MLWSMTVGRTEQGSRVVCLRLSQPQILTFLRVYCVGAEERGGLLEYLDLQLTSGCTGVVTVWQGGSEACSARE